MKKAIVLIDFCNGCPNILSFPMWPVNGETRITYQCKRRVPEDEYPKICSGPPMDEIKIPDWCPLEEVEK